MERKNMKLNHHQICVTLHARDIVRRLERRSYGEVPEDLNTTIASFSEGISGHCKDRFEEHFQRFFDVSVLSDTESIQATLKEFKESLTILDLVNVAGVFIHDVNTPHDKLTYVPHINQLKKEGIFAETLECRDTIQIYGLVRELVLINIAAGKEVHESWLRKIGNVHIVTSPEEYPSETTKTCPTVYGWLVRDDKNVHTISRHVIKGYICPDMYRKYVTSIVSGTWRGSV
jgi:hypothetical protein